MKNIHVIPTDKPSRLAYVFYENFYLLSEDTQFFEFQNLVQNRELFITSDEEIKEGDWHLVWLRGNWEVLNYMPSIGYRKECLGKEVCKIILTTDQDLIKDGVQAIDDEFLEWFVKNPSCEEVEATTYHVKGDISGKLHYKIIIPKEEQKQNLIDMMQDDEKSGLYNETLEEAAFNYAKSLPKAIGDLENIVEMYKRYSFVDGAKRQAERMYSEEDMMFAYEQGARLALLSQSELARQKGKFPTPSEWFEQFKKK